MNQDSFFSIGQHHIRNGSPCQDYANAFMIDGVSFAIISDGCSMAWDNFAGKKRLGQTDIGSRTVVEAAYQTFEMILKKYTLINKKELLQYLHTEYGKKELTEQLLKKFEILKINPLKLADYFATLMIAISTKEVTLFLCYGDGGFSYVTPNGLITHKIDFNNNIPFYLTYLTQGLDNYIANVIDINGSIGQITKYKINNRDIDFNKEEILNKKEVQEISKKHIQYGYSYLINNENIEYVSVFSDGMFDFKTSWIDCIISSHAFKNKNGEFVKRRMVKAQEKEGVNSLDDLSIAVISLIEA